MRRLSAAFFAGVVFLSGCSGSAPSAPTPTLFPPTSTTTVAPTTTTGSGDTPTTTIAAVSFEEVPLADHGIPDYEAKSDTFSFENFGGGEAPADLTVNMTRRLYGDKQVCSDVTDGQCTPYPVILQLMSQANKSMRGGLCEGLAVLSLRLAGDIETLAKFQNTQTVSELVKQDPALLSEIAYWYVTQFAMEVQQEAATYLEKSPTELAQVLLYDFAEAEKGNSHTGFTIGIYSDKGGHAVTPYRVEEKLGGYRIYIYDSNWPNEERWIDVSNEGQWIYALAATNPTEQSEAWSGGVGTMELTPMRSRSGPFTCSFCPKEEGEESGTMLTVAASGDKQMALKIETESGDRLGYYDGVFVNEIEGATYRYLISGPSTADPVLVFLPPGVESFSADVEEIDMPVPEKDKSTSTEDEIEEGIEEEIEEEKEQKFSLLVLNEEKSVQIEAVIVEEEEPEREEDSEGEIEEVDSLLDFSEEAIEIAEIEEATVAIAVDALEIEVELDANQQIEVAFAAEAQPGIPMPDQVNDTLDIAIQDDTGQTLAEVEVDMTEYRVEEQIFEEPTVTVPDQPEDTLPPEPVVVPVVIELVFDEEVGEIVQEEVEIEAWVASDAEYFQAVAEDRVEEVLGAAYVEEIESVDEWEAPEEFEEDEIDFVEILLAVDDEYWEDEQWDEVEYDEEWFEEEREQMDDLFGEAVDVEVLLEEVELFIEEVEEERVEFFEEYAELDEEAYWEEYEEEVYEEDFAFQEYDIEPEEQDIAEEQDIVEEQELLQEVEDESDMDITVEEDSFDEDWMDEEDETIFETDFGLEDEDVWGNWNEEEEEQDEETFLDVLAELSEEELEEWEEELEEWVEEPAEEPVEELVEEDDEWYDDEWEDEYEEGYEESTEDGDEAWWGDDEPEEQEEEGWLEESEEEVDDWDDEEYWEEDYEEDIEDSTEEDVDSFDEESLPEPDLPSEEEVDEEQVDETAVPVEEVDAEVPVEEVDDYEEQDEQDYDPYEDWGEPPPGYANWDDFEQEAAAGIVGGDDIEEYVPEAELTTFVEEVIPEPEPEPVVYAPTITYSSSTEDTLEIVSQETETVLTSQLVEAETTSVLAPGSDGHWYSTATTVTETTNSYVDTTTVVTRTQSVTTSCVLYDGVVSGCDDSTTYSEPETTVLVGDAYGPGTQTVTTVADPVPESCDQGGWTGMGDWCIVTSSGRNDRETVGFTIPGTTGTDPPVAIRIDAESNLDYAGWGQGSNHDDEHGDPYIFLFVDNDPDVGEHSGDITQITVSSDNLAIAINDDGGRDCDDNGGWQACLNPPSGTTDPDETPNVTLSDGSAVIDNIVDAWDSRIERNLNPGHYAVQGATYSTDTGGWYRLTIEEAD